MRLVWTSIWVFLQYIYVNAYDLKDVDVIPNGSKIEYKNGQKHEVQSYLLIPKAVSIKTTGTQQMLGVSQDYYDDIINVRSLIEPSLVSEQTHISSHQPDIQYAYEIKNGNLNHYNLNQDNADKPNEDTATDVTGKENAQRYILENGQNGNEDDDTEKLKSMKDLVMRTKIDTDPSRVITHYILQQSVPKVKHILTQHHEIITGDSGKQYYGQGQMNYNTGKNQVKTKGIKYHFGTTDGKNTNLLRIMKQKYCYREIVLHVVKRYSKQIDNLGRNGMTMDELTNVIQSICSLQGNAKKFWYLFFKLLKLRNGDSISVHNIRLILSILSHSYEYSSKHSVLRILSTIIEKTLSDRNYPNYGIGGLISNDPFIREDFVVETELPITNLEYESPKPVQPLEVIDDDDANFNNPGEDPISDETLPDTESPLIDALTEPPVTVSEKYHPYKISPQLKPNPDQEIYLDELSKLYEYLNNDDPKYPNNNVNIQIINPNVNTDKNHPNIDLNVYGQYSSNNYKGKHFPKIHGKPYWMLPKKIQDDSEEFADITRMGPSELDRDIKEMTDKNTASDYLQDGRFRYLNLGSVKLQDYKNYNDYQNISPDESEADTSSEYISVDLPEMSSEMTVAVDTENTSEWNQVGTTEISYSDYKTDKTLLIKNKVINSINNDDSNHGDTSNETNSEKDSEIIRIDVLHENNTKANKYDIDEQTESYSVIPLPSRNLIPDQIPYDNTENGTISVLIPVEIISDQPNDTDSIVNQKEKTVNHNNISYPQNQTLPSNTLKYRTLELYENNSESPPTINLIDNDMNRPYNIKQSRKSQDIYLQDPLHPSLYEIQNDADPEYGTPSYNQLQSDLNINQTPLRNYPDPYSYNTIPESNSHLLGKPNRINYRPSLDIPKDYSYLRPKYLEDPILYSQHPSVVPETKHLDPNPNEITTEPRPYPTIPDYYIISEPLNDHRKPMKYPKITNKNPKYAPDTDSTVNEDIYNSPYLNVKPLEITQRLRHHNNSPIGPYVDKTVEHQQPERLPSDLNPVVMTPKSKYNIPTGEPNLSPNSYNIYRQPEANYANHYLIKNQLEKISKLKPYDENIPTNIINYYQRYRVNPQPYIETNYPDLSPRDQPNLDPRDEPNLDPRDEPNLDPRDEPNLDPRYHPNLDPRDEPNLDPRDYPNLVPKDEPNLDTRDYTNLVPLDEPNLDPRDYTNLVSKYQPDWDPRDEPNLEPRYHPNLDPRDEPNLDPRDYPNLVPKDEPNLDPGHYPNLVPIDEPNLDPRDYPNLVPINKTYLNPRYEPNLVPLNEPNLVPIDKPNLGPIDEPNLDPRDYPNLDPRDYTNLVPIDEPNLDPRDEPNLDPRDYTNLVPIDEPNLDPRDYPNLVPIDEPNMVPTYQPNLDPRDEPNLDPRDEPNLDPRNYPNLVPIDEPNLDPRDYPNLVPINKPYLNPKYEPNLVPLNEPNLVPIDKPNLGPIDEPNLDPRDKPNLVPINESNLVPIDEPYLDPRDISSSLIQPSDNPSGTNITTDELRSELLPESVELSPDDAITTIEHNSPNNYYDIESSLPTDIPDEYYTVPNEMLRPKLHKNPIDEPYDPNHINIIYPDTSDEIPPDYQYIDPKSNNDEIDPTIHKINNPYINNDEIDPKIFEINNPYINNDETDPKIFEINNPYINNDEIDPKIYENNNPYINNDETDPKIFEINNPYINNDEIDPKIYENNNPYINNDETDPKIFEINNPYINNGETDPKIFEIHNPYINNDEIDPKIYENNNPYINNDEIDPKIYENNNPYINNDETDPTIHKTNNPYINNDETDPRIYEINNPYINNNEIDPKIYENNNPYINNDEIDPKIYENNNPYINNDETDPKIFEINNNSQSNSDSIEPNPFIIEPNSLEILPMTSTEPIPSTESYSTYTDKPPADSSKTNSPKSQETDRKNPIVKSVVTLYETPAIEDEPESSELEVKTYQTTESKPDIYSTTKTPIVKTPTTQRAKLNPKKPSNPLNSVLKYFLGLTKHSLRNKIQQNLRSQTSNDYDDYINNLDDAKNLYGQDIKRKDTIKSNSHENWSRNPIIIYLNLIRQKDKVRTKLRDEELDDTKPKCETKYIYVTNEKPADNQIPQNNYINPYTHYDNINYNRGHLNPYHILNNQLNWNPYMSNSPYILPNKQNWLDPYQNLNHNQYTMPNINGLNLNNGIPKAIYRQKENIVQKPYNFKMTRESEKRKDSVSEGNELENFVQSGQIIVLGDELDTPNTPEAELNNQLLDELKKIDKNNTIERITKLLNSSIDIQKKVMDIVKADQSTPSNSDFFKNILTLHRASVADEPNITPTNEIITKLKDFLRQNFKKICDLKSLPQLFKVIDDIVEGASDKTR